MLKKRLFSLFILAALLCCFTVTAAAAQVTASIAPSGMVLVGDTLFVADSYYRSIWTVADGQTTLFAGRTDVRDLSDRPVEAYVDGPLDQAAFGEPWAMVEYLDGFLVTDRTNHVIRYVDLKKGRVDTALGTGKAGKQDAYGVRASFDSPTGLAVGDDGTLYIADTGNHRIRAMDPKGKVTTYAGGGEGNALGSLSQARFSQPTGLCFADGVLYVADSGNHRIVAIADGQATLVAGAALTGDAAQEGGYLNGPADLAQFANPQGVSVLGHTVYVADSGNGAVRAIRDGYVTTILAISNGATYPVSPRGILAQGDTLYVGDAFSRVLLELDAAVAEPAFTDVAPSAYYASAVRFAAANGFLQGTGPDRFSPDLSMTRGMVLTVLARVDGGDTGGGATWYETGVQWAQETGVSDGSAPMSPVTREQLVTMLHRYAGEPSPSGQPLDFPDSAAVSDYAASAMAWAVETGIINGKGNGALDPQGLITRGETVTILARFLLP